MNFTKCPRYSYDWINLYRVKVFFGGKIPKNTWKHNINSHQYNGFRTKKLKIKKKEFGNHVYL